MHIEDVCFIKNILPDLHEVWQQESQTPGPQATDSPQPTHIQPITKYEFKCGGWSDSPEPPSPHIKLTWKCLMDEQNQENNLSK